LTNIDKFVEYATIILTLFYFTEQSLAPSGATNKPRTTNDFDVVCWKLSVVSRSARRQRKVRTPLWSRHYELILSSLSGWVTANGSRSPCGATADRQQTTDDFVVNCEL